MPHRPLFPLLRVALAVACGGVLLCTPRSRFAQPEPRPADELWVTDINGMPDSEAGATGRKATGPVKGQKRPPCSVPLEREYVGGCWLGTEHSPPCPAPLYEGQGRCLAPVYAAKRPPTSIGE